MIFRLLFCLVATACLVAGTSRARNQLLYLEALRETSIRTPTHRVNAFSHFDIDLSLQQHDARIRLSLEPNHDVLSHDATVNFLSPEGHIVKSETIDRVQHKVFKGTALAEREDGSWVNVGWARITVLRDGIHPLFEGAFSVNRDNHHVQLRSSFMRAKHALDPVLEDMDDEYMVLFKDSDIAPHVREEHSELKRAVAGLACSSDQLEFNMRPDHPVYSTMMKKDDSHWGVMPIGSLFGKRQIDTQSSGNTAGVNLVSTIGQSEGCPTTRKVALVGVATDCEYTGHFNSTETVKQNVINVMNSASAIWETTFNISLGLQNLTISDANCPGTVQAATQWNQNCESNLNIQDRLNLFSAWRGTLGDQNSHWTLMTKCNTGSAVGLAWLGQACVHDAITTNTTTGESETVSGANVVALTSTEWQVVAHETGHTYGAVHDCDSSTCADSITVRTQQCCPLSSGTCDANSQFIMNPYTASSITEFSACTVGNICSAIGRNSVNTTCLSANKGVITISGATCGNGIVEEGEECDCGGVAGCGDDTCCDPSTCRFTNGAVCDDANEDCCSSCQFASSGSVCRASTGTCDPAETCTGTSAICPADKVATDGDTCTLAGSSATDLACASGQCTSRNYQCRTVMAGYISSGTANETYACDSETCTLSCASPAFGSGVCYGLQQNLLDGTPCGGGGKCSNGACRGSTFGKEVESWINSHKGVVIGVASGVGALVLLALVSCITSKCKRSRARKRAKASAPPNGGGSAWFGVPPTMQQQQQQQMQMQPPQGWNYEQQQHGWRPPAPQQQSYASPPAYMPPPPPPSQQHDVLYGSGIIGSRAPDGTSGGSAWPQQHHRPLPPPYAMARTTSTPYV